MQLATAASHHQQALRVGIALKSTQAQCVSVGNLGLVALAQGDRPTARACLGQHLQLARALHDRSAEAAACVKLGLLANVEGQYPQALHFFQEARRIAAECGERAVLKEATCHLGVANGNLRMQEHMQGFLRTAHV